MAGDGWRDDDGILGKVKKIGPNPTDRGKQGVKRSVLTEGVDIAVALDKGDDYHEVRAIFKEFGSTAHTRARGEEAKAIKKTGSGLQGTPLDGRANAQLGEPLSPNSRSLGETARLSIKTRINPFALRHHHLACNWPTGIGS